MKKKYDKIVSSQVKKYLPIYVSNPYFFDLDIDYVEKKYKKSSYYNSEINVYESLFNISKVICYENE